MYPCSCRIGEDQGEPTHGNWCNWPIFVCHPILPSRVAFKTQEVVCGAHSTVHKTVDSEHGICWRVSICRSDRPCFIQVHAEFDIQQCNKQDRTMKTSLSPDALTSSTTKLIPNIILSPMCRATQCQQCSAFKALLLPNGIVKMQVT